MTAGGEGIPVAEVVDLRVHFPTSNGHETVKAIDGVSLRIMKGQTFGVIGESGSGKSTLGRALVCLTRPTGGRVLHQGVDPYSLSGGKFRAHRRGYQIVFQDPNAALNPRMTILDAVREPLDVIGGTTLGERNRIATEMLDRVELGPDYADRYPHELSGGQKQRVNIARALTVQPKLLVCDEVVAALDVSIQAEVLNLFLALQRDFGLTYLFITHDLGVVSHVSDTIAVMYLGVLVEISPAELIRSRPLHPYTEALLSAEPAPLPTFMRTSQRIILEGEIPSPISPPSGCRFRTRCRYVKDRCASEVPALREIEPGRRVACHFAETFALQASDIAGVAAGARP
jgi:peptide/nickel transport system ATP-binding protein/oligopeptide transport system ATP-binding protein